MQQPVRPAYKVSSRIKERVSALPVVEGTIRLLDHRPVRPVLLELLHRPLQIKFGVYRVLWGTSVPNLRCNVSLVRQDPPRWLSTAHNAPLVVQDAMHQTRAQGCAMIVLWEHIPR